MAEPMLAPLRMRRLVTPLRLIAVLPMVTFLGFGAILGLGLGRDPSEIPSALIDRPVPVFALPPVPGRTSGLGSRDLAGEVSLVNVFASWCAACRQEHALLVRLGADGIVPIHGLNYKDRPEDAARWLDTLGDPYRRTGTDRDGRVAIDWGVYGVPETFVVDAGGRIVHKHVGPVTEKALQQTILPLVARLRRGKDAQP